MKLHDFCYWLQGYFELNSEASLRKTHECIEKHINLVEQDEGVQDFTSWLKGVIETYKEVDYFSDVVKDRAAKYEKNILTMIQGRLSEVFVKEIDPKYGKSLQNPLNMIHRGKMHDISRHKPGRRMKC